MSLALKYANLFKSYGDIVALAGLSLEVVTGELFGLIGPDGAGKTTAMRIACGLLKPNSGTVQTLGCDPIREGARVKEAIGYMPQRFSLYPDLSIEENLRFFADLYLVPSEERIKREERLMQFSRLGPFRTRRAGQLSGGMKQKLALSCTLVHTPKLLILDEPTTGVDPVSRREFWDILRELKADGISLLVSTPYMDEALLCDRVALMHRGKVMATGKPGELTRLSQSRLMEIRGEELLKAWQILNTPDNRDVRCYRFGDRIHVAFVAEEQRSWAEKQIRGILVETREIAPTIEDTFIELISKPMEEA